MINNEKVIPAVAVTHETVMRKLIKNNVIPATAISRETAQMMCGLPDKEMVGLCREIVSFGLMRPYTRPEGEAGRIFDRVIEETMEDRHRVVAEMVEDAGGFKAPVAAKLGISMAELEVFLKG